MSLACSFQLENLKRFWLPKLSKTEFLEMNLCIKPGFRVAAQAQEQAQAQA